MDLQKTIALRMERQHLLRPASKEEYLSLYRDLQPGLNVYWNGFGQPPVLSFRADFDDIEYNRKRQSERTLIKGRFAGGNLGWIIPEDLELFIALYRKPLTKPTFAQMRILEIIEREGPLNIQQMKEETLFLVKEITPALHRLQEAFLLYEDQYDGEWDRSWYPLTEMFPSVDFNQYTRQEALYIILQRFAYRQVYFDLSMARAYYKLPIRDLRQALDALVTDSVLVEIDDGYMLASDAVLLKTYEPQPMHFVYAIHRNDFLYRSNEPMLKEQFKSLYTHLPYDHEPLQYLLIDGEFHGASVGHFRNGPYDLNDVVCDLPIDSAMKRRDEILEAVRSVNFGRIPQRFMGEIV